MSIMDLRGCRAATLSGTELYLPSAGGEEAGHCDQKLERCFDTVNALQETH